MNLPGGFREAPELGPSFNGVPVYYKICARGTDCADCGPRVDGEPQEDNHTPALVTWKQLRRERARREAEAAREAELFDTLTVLPVPRDLKGKLYVPDPDAVENGMP